MRFERAFKKNPVDAVVVVKKFDMPQPGNGASDMGVQLRRTMRRQRYLKGLAQCGHFEKAGVASATGRVSLKAIHRPELQHSKEIARKISILPRSNIHPGRSAIAQKPQTLQVI